MRGALACQFVALVCALLLAARLPAQDASSTVAVAAAANLVYALDALNAEFRRAAPDVRVTVTTGASGTLFAQLKHRAPFDVFLSADTDYPRQAVAGDLATPDSLRVFATGRLVFWSTRTTVDVTTDLPTALRSARKIAVAQPKTAPYGRATQAALEHLGLWSSAEPKLVFGESITQTAQFVETGNADAGFVAMSIVLSPRLAGRGRWHEVPATLYPGVSLDHAAVLTTRGAQNAAARRYLDFLSSDAARKILRDFGYAVP